MVETRWLELKKEQDATNTMVGGLVDRLELITQQMKDMQVQSEGKWEVMQSSLLALGNSIQEMKRGELRVEVTRAEAALAKRKEDNESVDRIAANYSLPKIEFPDFDGNNLDDWLYKCNRYFELERTPEDAKVKLASLYMYGGALQWHYTFLRNRPVGELLGWTEYVAAVTKRFGREVFEDPMGRMKNLKQEGVLSNLYVYMEEFDSCLRKVLERIELPVDFQISLFINGLREEYRNTLWLLRPTDLLSAQASARLLTRDVPPDSGSAGLARLNRPINRGLVSYQGTTNTYNRGKEPVVTKIASSGGNIVPKAALMPGGRRRLTQEEIAERRLKGLCFGCNEPFSREHKCARRQFFSLIVDEGDDEIVDEEERKSRYEDDRGEEFKVTLHALNGEIGDSSIQTMKLTGSYKKKTLHILIDSGSTHNFVDASVFKELGVSITPIKPIRVMVADGRTLLSNKLLRQFTWNMQGQVFEADFYVIPLVGCEMVLGVKWLSQLGDIVWNFKWRTMKFQQAQQEVILRGIGAATGKKLLTVAEKGNIRCHTANLLVPVRSRGSSTP
ncbi:hypothetical protein MLD38_023180 [Melastoma candidum]|uniref:Uncharacterized protein n=2 Tax=Melastoma candidum TaxID=119954 RepID=A0ACB9QLQ0_9MYRT|nr:hypothetical protein MLD38_037731 [Melastoma candidum]KAI4367441.1 hypothetical protein MLD38_023180 [Melastoma candidum]